MTWGLYLSRVHSEFDVTLYSDLNRLDLVLLRTIRSSRVEGDRLRLANDWSWRCSESRNLLMLMMIVMLIVEIDTVVECD
jgi:hypothetical protein